MRIVFMLPLGMEDVMKLKQGNVEFMRNQADSFLLPLVYSFLHQGHTVTIITMSTADGFNVSIDNLTVVNLKQYRHGNISALLSFKREINSLYKILERIEYDVIHAHWCYEYAGAALKASVEKTVITLHDWPGSIAEYSGNFYWKARLKMGFENVKKSKHLIAVSPYIKELVTEIYPEKNVWVIPNFLPDEFYTGASKDDCGERYLFIAITNATKRKNVECALKAFKILNKRFPSSILQLYGSGLSENDSIYKYALSNGLATNVIFGGAVSHIEIIDKLEAAHFLLHTSYEESFGMILIEAMSKNVIALAGDSSGGPPWVLNYGKCGILADITSPEDVASSIIDCIVSHKDKEIRMDALEYAKNNFALSKAVNETLRFYKAM